MLEYTYIANAEEQPTGDPPAYSSGLVTPCILSVALLHNDVST